MTDVFTNTDQGAADAEAHRETTSLRWKLGIGGVLLLAIAGSVTAIGLAVGAANAIDPAEVERATERCIAEYASGIVDAGARTPEEAAAEGCALFDESELLERFGD